MKQALMIATVVLAILSAVFYFADNRIWAPLLLATVIALVAAVFTNGAAK